MMDRHPFKDKPENGVRCEEWEAWLAESLDGNLPEKAKAAFEAHGHSCPLCSELLTRAAEGRDWMQYLQEEPHVPPALVGKILDQTTGAGGAAVPGGAAPVQAASRSIPTASTRATARRMVVLIAAIVPHRGKRAREL